MNYNQKIFKVVKTTENGEVSDTNTFTYFQNGNILTCEYSGGEIVHGHLLGLVDAKGNIEMRYHQINSKNELVTGRCKSTPEILPNGKIRLHEKWEWTSGNMSNGSSIIEEV